jgi:hypothetical protein
MVVLRQHRLLEREGMSAVMIVAAVMVVLLLARGPVVMIGARLGIATMGMAVSEQADPHLVAPAPTGRTHS